MKIRKNLNFGEECPRGYRMSWFDFRMHRAVCYPIGLHLIAWAVWWLWQETFHPLPEPHAKTLRDTIQFVKDDNLRLYEQIDELRAEVDKLDKDVRERESIIHTYCLLLEAMQESESCSPAEPS